MKDRTTIPAEPALRTASSAEDELFTVGEAAQRLKVSTSWLNKLRATRDGPPFFKLGNCIRYRSADLDGWVAERIARSTADYDTHWHDAKFPASPSRSTDG